MSKNPQLGPIEWLILDYAYEDWTELFELRPLLAEEGDEHADARKLAFIIGLDRLIDAGLIEVLMRPDRLTFPGPPVSDAEAKALVRDDIWWADPRVDEPVVTLSVTKLGKQFVEERAGTRLT
jgi:hypothetical protein